MADFTYDFYNVVKAMHISRNLLKIFTLKAHDMQCNTSYDVE